MAEIHHQLSPIWIPLKAGFYSTAVLSWYMNLQTCEPTIKITAQPWITRDDGRRHNQYFEMLLKKKKDGINPSSVDKFNTDTNRMM